MQNPLKHFGVKYTFINYIFALIMCDFICKMCVFEGSETGPIYIAVGGGVKVFRIGLKFFVGGKGI